jgi:hypothetical protein
VDNPGSWCKYTFHPELDKKNAVHASEWSNTRCDNRGWDEVIHQQMGFSLQWVGKKPKIHPASKWCFNK